MNMPAFNVTTQQPNVQPHINEVINANVLAITSARWQSAFTLYENEDAVFQMLDARFPLQERSHKDVTQYVVYFRHIMAFFADGTHCGLDCSKQFVAYDGSKEQPSSILLQENNLHVELMLNRSTIEDVQIEFPTQREFITPDGDAYTV